MIDDATRYLSCIVARISRTSSCQCLLTMVFPFSQTPTNDDLGPIDRIHAHFRTLANFQKGWSIENEERKKFEDEVAKGTGRAANSVACKRQKSRRKRERMEAGGELHRGFADGREAKEDKRISYKALLSGWVAGVAIVLCFDSARWTRLTFNRCAFADDDEGDPPTGDNNIVTLSSCLDHILLLPIVLSFFAFLHSAERFFLPFQKSSALRLWFPLLLSASPYCIHRIFLAQDFA